MITKLSLSRIPSRHDIRRDRVLLRKCEVIPFEIEYPAKTLCSHRNWMQYSANRMDTELLINANVEDVVKSISEQYLKPAVAFPKNRSAGPGYEWQLDGGKVLRFTPPRRGLHLVATALADKADQEAYRRWRVPVPKL